MQPLKRFLESIDIFDKFSEDEYRVRTLRGAVLSLVLFLFGAFFLCAQIFRFLTPDLTRNLGASRTVPGETTFVNISLTILVFSPCAFLRFDTVDSLGFSQLYANTVTLRRFSRNGSFLGISASPDQSQCDSCFGALPEGDCCNSCEELILLHKLKDLTPTPEQWPQCSNYSENLPNLNEICHLKGKLTVNRVSGIFVVRPRRRFFIEDPPPSFNLSHLVGRIRFGPKLPSTSMPLEAIHVIQASGEPLHYTYHLMCTPVLFVRDGEILERTYEYAPIILVQNVNEDTRLPGLFFWYQFVPYTVTVVHRTRAVSSFVSATFGLLAGGFAIASWLDRWLNAGSGQKMLD